jgi:diguanylate cyclase (GGDEF)-like protein/PAS domain S-box-containing protein
MTTVDSVRPPRTEYPPAPSARSSAAALPAHLDLEQLYQQAPCGYLVLADDGTISAVNDTFLHWTGHRREDLVGTGFQRLLPVGDRILFSTHCQPQLAMVGAVAEIVIDVTGSDGARRAALLTAARTPATDTAPASTRVIVFSAHERRSYEQELVAALHRAEESEARRASAEADLQFLALHDSLTGLLNRAGLTAHLEALTGARGDTCTGLGALFIDLDHFKAVNDSLGHAAGDELLTVVADRMRAAVRDSATIARLAGDEFVVVDALADPAQLGSLAQRLLDAVTAPMVIEGMEIVVSASIGAALAEGAEDTGDGLLRHADIAMYRAKSRGRNCWELHDSSRTDPAVDRLRLLGDLRRGIGAGEMRLHYQPRMDVRTGLIAGVEALVRWDHPTRGLLAPSHFIDIAEESGLILTLGAWILDEAVAQAVRWHHAHPDAPRVEMAVNLSTRQLADPDLLDTVTTVLAQHRLDPALLTLEITETALMGDTSAALATLHALKALGVGLAVDDFGTGYSSLTYLKQFPIDELKIDRSFVAGLGADHGDSAIVASCVQLAHAIGIRAVAEGVETETQRLALLDMHCDLAQGFHYAQPLVPDVIGAWLSGDAER